VPTAHARPGSVSGAGGSRGRRDLLARERGRTGAGDPERTREAADPERTGEAAHPERTRKTTDPERTGEILVLVVGHARLPHASRPGL
jgi:hypothetical protein